MDYTAEEGSTKITVLSQTFGHIRLTDDTVAHTLAAEFRNDSNELKRSAQNVYLNYIKQNSGGSSTPSTPGTWWPSNSYPQTTPSFESVTAVMSIVSPDGTPISDLSLELHSTVQHALTGSDGSAQFDNVEFGRHTLYATDLSTGKKVSKSFTIVSGFNTDLNGDIIVAEVGQILNITIQYDGNSLTLLSAETEVDVSEDFVDLIDTEVISEAGDVEVISEGNDDNSAETDEANSFDDHNPTTGVALCIIPSLAAMVAYAICKKK